MTEQRPWKARHVVLAAAVLIGAYATLARAHGAERVDLQAVCNHLNEAAPADDRIVNVGREAFRCTVKPSAKPVHSRLADWNDAELWALNHGARVVFIGPEDDGGSALPNEMVDELYGR